MNRKVATALLIGVLLLVAQALEARQPPTLETMLSDAGYMLSLRGTGHRDKLRRLESPGFV